MWVDAYYWEETHIMDFENNRKATSKIKEKDIKLHLCRLISENQIKEGEIEYWQPLAGNIRGYDNYSYCLESRIRRLYYSIKTIDKLKQGVLPIDIDWVKVLQDVSLTLDHKRRRGYVDYVRLFYIINSTTNKAIRLKIIEAVINSFRIEQELIATTTFTDEHGITYQFYDTPINIDTFINYLSNYYCNWVALMEDNEDSIKEELIYSISTDLTKKQLVALLGRLKDNGFIAPEQTEEDFLNAFNPKAPKQGKIHWGKVGNRRKGINATTIIYFIHKTNDKLTVKYPQKDVIAIIRSIFEIEVTKVNLSTTKSKIDNGENIEYKEEVDRLFEHI